ncbi:MAG: radical SAM protein [Candidatus Omnitrophota bacterium]
MNYLKEFEVNLAYHFSEVLEQPLVQPRWVYISLSHNCTYNCRMCMVVKTLKGYELSKEVLERAFEQIALWPRNRTVVITGGEPFLRKDIFEIINSSVIKGIETEAVSNGALINEELAFKIISSGLGNIAISLDGAKEDTHDFIREKGSFKKAVKAIKNLVEVKQKIKSGPQISVWTTIMKENMDELSDIIYLVRDLGVECLVYHPVIVAQADMQNTSSSAPFWIKEEGLKFLEKQIDKIIAYKRKNGLVAFLHNPYLWIKYFRGNLTKKDWKCNPFAFINVGPDAEMRSCGASFGNIKEMDMKSCLNTEEAFKARKLMKSCPKPCLQTCWAHPESDSLPEIIDNFIDSVKNNKDKGEFLKQALKILERYEDKVKGYKDA